MTIPDLDSKASVYFSWRELLWLPSWNRAATEEDGLTQDILDNLSKLAHKMDLVREFFQMPVIVHCAYRPEEYNKLVGGAANSPHKFGQAMDFHLEYTDCNSARSKILTKGKLDDWKIRMEHLPGSNWVHLDIREPGPSGRYFTP